MTAFDYPDMPHVRRHGPRGYTDHGGYRSWLRDEFTFRCVYCLFREQWGRAIGEFDIEHLQPQAISPDLALDYDNLLYACHSCNLLKGMHQAPDATKVLISEQIRLDPDGSIAGLTAESRWLVEVVGLNSHRYCEWRLTWMRIIDLAREYDPVQFRRLMGFPDDLPDLSLLRPPGNSRPDGVEQSWHARRARGELPDVY